MRIIYSHRINSRDGQAVHVEETINALREAGHEVLVIGPTFYAHSNFGGSDWRIDLLRRLLPGALGEISEIAYAIPATYRLLRAWRRFEPDFIYERYNLYHFAGSYLARHHGAVLLLEINSPLAAERRHHGGLRLQSLARWAERFIWRSATHVLPVTAVLGGVVVQCGVERRRVTIIPNAIVPARFPRQPRENSRPVLGFVGFVRDWHGLDSLLDAMAADALPLDLIIVGDGPALPALRLRTEALGLSRRVRFTGLIPHTQIPAVMAEFSIALQPRVTSYASPLKVFDYMAAGCAIVAPDQPNIREVLTNEVTALLFDPVDPSALWTAVRRLADDSALRARLGQAARARALSHHTWAGNAKTITDLWTRGVPVRFGL